NAGRSVTFQEFPLPSPFSFPRAITAGPDGNVWFVEQNTGRIGRITPAGVIPEFTLPPPPADPLTPRDITAGPDGNLWFTEGGPEEIPGHVGEGVIGRITPAGVITEFHGLNGPQDIAAGSSD